jgi:hypothetical protein
VCCGRTLKVDAERLAVIFIGWKLLKRTSFRRASEMDFTSDLQELVRCALLRRFAQPIQHLTRPQKAYEDEFHSIKDSRPPSKNVIKRVNRYLWE